MRPSFTLPALVAAVMVAGIASRAAAYHEFQSWIDARNDRTVNCAFCHAHGDGPDGVKPGQIGALTPEQLTMLNEARQAFEPAPEVESPILNAFGNEIVRRLGRTQFIHLRQSPGDFPDAYGFDSDLDHDGIADAQEVLDATHPVNNQSGRPLALFLHNLRTSWGHVLMLVVATLFGLVGINSLLAWFTAVTRAAATPPPDEGEAPSVYTPAAPVASHAERSR